MMSGINILLYELVQVAVGRRLCLSRTPSECEWNQLFQASKMHALLGVCFYGVHLLHVHEQLVNMPHRLKMQWLAAAMQIKQRNEIVNQRCIHLHNLLKNAGFNNLILKGQGIAQLYNSTVSDSKVNDLSFYRQSGDIDVWVDATKDEVIEFVAMQQYTDEFDEKHIHFDYFDDVPVELHWIPVKKWNPRWNKILKEYFNKEKGRQFIEFDNDFCCPTVDFQLVHQLLHVQGHFISGGIGVRQIMDLYFAQISCVTQMPERIPEVLQLFKRMNMLKFVAALQWVLNEVFQLNGEDSNLLICDPDEREGRMLLNEIEIGGNFGQHNRQNKTQGHNYLVRFWIKWRRKLKLIRFDTFGAIVMPFARFGLEISHIIKRRRLKSKFIDGKVCKVTDKICH